MNGVVFQISARVMMASAEPSGQRRTLWGSSLPRYPSPGVHAYSQPYAATTVTIAYGISTACG